jgi:tripeptidyl-peptidase-1
MADHIELVAGLSEFPTPRFAAKKVQKPEALVSIVPQTVQLMYKTAGAKIVGNSSAGVIEFEDQYFSPTDLSQFASQFAVPITPVTAKHIVGNNDPSNPQIEATLDIQYILGVGTGAKGWFWIEGDNVWLYGFATHMFTTVDVPLVNSISYGWNEEAQCQDGIGGAECQSLGLNNKQYVQRINIEFQKVGLRGITLICASGDSGANGRTDPSCSENHLNPVFPAASPYITSVGATQISASSGRANLPNPPPGCSGQNCASSGTEECVSYAQANFASGGGFSDIAPLPVHQRTAVTNYFKSGVKLPPASYYNPDGRGFPDVAAFGSAVLILSEGQIEAVGGTSASSPIVAGIVSLLNDYVNTKTGKPLGHIAPLLYKMAEEHPSAFTDITVGDNICTEGGCDPNCKGFLATKGWDPVSGLGTPVYTEMLKYIDSKVVKK